MKSALKRVFVKFLKNSTLHGFKYLRSSSYSDRIGWVLFSIISFCCGVALCLVFWERYLATPALVTMRPVVSPDLQPIPRIYICPTPDRLAELLKENLIPQEYVERIFKYEHFVSKNQVVSLVLNCPGRSKSPACEFTTKFPTEDYRIPDKVSAGSLHRGKMTFQLISFEETVGNSFCELSETYSRRRCLTLCKERICGCGDPTRPLTNFDTEGRKLCSISEYNCLMNIPDDDCNCFPSCKVIISDITYVHVDMDALQFTYDPFLLGLNKSEDAVLDIIVKTFDSKLFYCTPTETWLTLMSSLGGVFNMFLGVGVFSALEILYLLFVQVPVAITKSVNIGDVSTPIKVKPKPVLIE